MYNPMQSRMDALMQQKNMIEQQMQALQQYANIPPININNQIAPNQPNTGDFSGVWVDGVEQAKAMSNGVPTIYFERNNAIFYMKNNDGSLRKFKFEEVFEEAPTNNGDKRIDELEAKMNMILDALTKPKEEGESKDE